MVDFSAETALDSMISADIRKSFGKNPFAIWNPESRCITSFLNSTVSIFILPPLLWTEKHICFPDLAKQVEKGKSNFGGNEIKGKTLGVIGLGAIGILVANAAIHLGMNVIGYDPYVSVDAAWKLSRAVEKADDLEEIYAKCDIISLHVPQIDSTKGMINNDTIAKMKDGAMLINTARGGIVNETDLYVALSENRIKAAYFDVFSSEPPKADEPLLTLPNFYLTPHIASRSKEAEKKTADMATQIMIEQLKKV